MNEIPLDGGLINAQQEFSVQLGEWFCEFKLFILENGQWNFDMRRDGSLVVAGAILTPNVDLWATYPDLQMGKLVMVGEEPTLDNLGVANNLVWVNE